MGVFAWMRSSHFEVLNWLEKFKDAPFDYAQGDRFKLSWSVSFPAPVFFFAYIAKHLFDRAGPVIAKSETFRHSAATFSEKNFFGLDVKKCNPERGKQRILVKTLYNENQSQSFLPVTGL